MTARTVRQQDDVNFAFEAIRVCLHIWPLIMGVFALTPALSSETSLLVDYGAPKCSLGVVLLAGWVMLMVGRASKGLWKRWTLAAGDFIVGSECLTMAAMMAIASAHGHASWLSVGLWLLPGLMFELLCVIRARG